jgi:hypothetical protein
MKKILGLLMGAALCGGLGGWVAANATIERRAAAKAAQSQVEEQAQARRLGARFAELVGNADRITFEPSDAGENSAISVGNADWQQNFARGLAAGTYQRTALPLGIFPPFVHVYRGEREVLFYQAPGLILCHELEADGVFQMDRETADAIYRALLAKLPGSA